MSDWAVGDLALCVADYTGFGTGQPEPWEPSPGGVYHVSAVFPGDGSGQVLDLEEDPYVNPFDGFQAERFRKIRPDEISGDIHDWELLLDQLSKPRVSA